MKTAIKESSYVVYESAFRLQTLPELGRLRLDQIDRERMEDFIAVLMEKDLEKDSIKGFLGALRVLMNDAIEKGIVENNPVRGKSGNQAKTILPIHSPLPISWLKCTWTTNL